MTERKLASIKKIDDIRPIEGADVIECAIIGGWTVVVKKGDFKPGDLCVYFEIDSVLPVTPEFEFLRKSCYVKKDWIPNGEGFRLRTMRMRKQLSQGLVIPVKFVGDNDDATIFAAGVALSSGSPTWGWGDTLEGMDVTSQLGVIKWDPPPPPELAGLIKGYFPSFIPKTDEERIQNYVQEVFVDHKDDEYEISMKLDGSSMTAYLYNGEDGVCSRNLDLKICDENKDNIFVRMFFDKGIRDALWWIARNVAIQGEVMGPGIQENKERLSKHQFYIFRIYDIDARKFLTPEERYDFVDQMIEYGYSGSHVPVLAKRTKLPFNDVFSLLKYADGPSLNPEQIREGLVYKNIQGTFSFKTISNMWLEKFDK